MTFSTKVAAGIMLAAATSTALTGCGKAKTSGTTSPSASMSSHHSMSSSATSTSTSGGSGKTTATIGGKTKYIEAGQQCQQAHAGDYTKYGFTCADNGSGKWVLTKN